MAYSEVALGLDLFGIPNPGIFHFGLDQKSPGIRNPWDSDRRFGILKNPQKKNNPADGNLGFSRPKNPQLKSPENPQSRDEDF